MSDLSLSGLKPVLALSVMALTLACGSAGFGGSTGQVGASRPVLGDSGPTLDGGTSPAPSQSPGSQNTGAGSATATATGTQSEGQTADQPQQVTGAFLVCNAVESPEVATDQASYGCRVQTGNVMADLFNAQQVDWDVVAKVGGASMGSAASIVRMPPGSPWHVLVTMPRSAAVGKEVTVSIEWSAQSAADVLTADLDNLPAGVTWSFGSDDQPLHLGDGLFDDSHCSTKVKEVPLTGARLTIPFTVPAGGANVTVSLSGVCGIDYDQLSTLVVQGKAAPLATVALRLGHHGASAGLLVLPAGDYSVQLTSGEADSGDRDDFIVNHIFIASDAAITSSAPQATSAAALGNVAASSP